MSMSDSYEIGWIITDKGNFEVEDHKAFFGKIKEDDNGHFVPDSEDLNRGQPLYFETHPDDENRVFVTWDELDHGDTSFGEPEDLGKLVRDFVKTLGDYDVDWGVIVTSR